MHTSRLTYAAAIVALLLTAGLIRAADHPQPPDKPAKILLLGTFHFTNPGRDTYKPQHDIDILSETRQSELAHIAQCLSNYHPTKIAVETDLDFTDTLDARYQRYLAGDFALPVNEIYQLGFRLAKMNGLSRVYPVDADRRFFEPQVDPDEYAVAHGQAEALAASETPWNDYYMALYAYEDSIKTTQTLEQTFLQMNSPARIILGHGHYLIGSFKAGEGTEYPGADAATSWYNRNLRIFANLTRITDSVDDRILLIVGAGHLAIIRHAIEASPQYELVELSDFLSEHCK